MCEMRYTAVLYTGCHVNFHYILCTGQHASVKTQPISKISSKENGQINVFRSSNGTSGFIHHLIFETCSEISSEDQVCWNTGYDCMFGDIALAVLSGPGRRSTHPASWVGFICPFVVIYPPDIGATPGLMLDHLQPIPDAGNLPF